jgi:hypothetical protein
MKRAARSLDFGTYLPLTVASASIEQLDAAILSIKRCATRPCSLLKSTPVSGDGAPTGDTEVTGSDDIVFCTDRLSAAPGA